MVTTSQHDDAEDRSNVESFGIQRGADNPRGPQHSGEGRLGQNLILLVVLMAVFCFGIYTLGFYPDGGWIWWMASTLLMLAPWGIVYHLLSSKTNSAKRETGTELTQL